MILFYSKHCNHSSMLISNISRYDKDKRIKLVCIDDLLSENIGIEKKNTNCSSIYDIAI